MNVLRMTLAVLLLSLAAGADAATPPAAFRFAAVDEGAVGLWDGDRPVLVYNHGTRSKEGVPADRRRSSYVHPLYGLDGEVLTDDFPKDHYHHRGLFWAWPHVQVGGKAYDLWMLRGITHRFERLAEKKADADKAVLAVENGWYVGDRRVVAERVTLTVFPVKDDGRRIDVELRLTVDKDPVTLGGAEGKGYGGLSLRFAPRKGTVVRTPDGVAKADLNLEHLPWADLSGQFEGAPGPSGIALLLGRDHPAPEPEWITRTYGFLGAGWPGTPSGTLQPGQPVTCRYHLWVHRGVPDGPTLSRLHAGVVQP